MLLELILPQAGLDAEITAFDHDGKKISATVARLEIKPIFFGARDVSRALFGTVKGGAKNEETGHRFVLTLSGGTGQCKIQNKSKPVTSAYDIAADSEDAEDEPVVKSIASGGDGLIELPDAQPELARKSKK